MESGVNNKLVNKKKFEVLLFDSPACFPVCFIRHSWFVINEKGKFSRWEVLYRRNKNKSFGFLHKDDYPLFSGIDVLLFTNKWRWNSRFLGKCDGVLAKDMIKFIKSSKKNYPYLHKYYLSFLNSNTYIKWILKNFPKFKGKLSWNAMG